MAPVKVTVTPKKGHDDILQKKHNLSRKKRRAQRKKELEQKYLSRNESREVSKLSSIKLLVPSTTKPALLKKEFPLAISMQRITEGQLKFFMIKYKNSKDAKNDHERLPSVRIFGEKVTGDIVESITQDIFSAHSIKPKRVSNIMKKDNAKERIKRRPLEKKVMSPSVAGKKINKPRLIGKKNKNVKVAGKKPDKKVKK